MTDVNPVATAIAALTGKANNMLERKKGSIMGMHEIALKHQLDHESFLKRTATVHHLAEPGSKVTLDVGKDVKATYTKGGKKPVVAKKPAVKKAPAAKKPAVKSPAKPQVQKKTAANTKTTGVTSTVPIKNAKSTKMSTRAGGRR